MCLQCHEKEVKCIFNSQHYQWQGNAPRIINAKGRKLGKLNKEHAVRDLSRG